MNIQKCQAFGRILAHTIIVGAGPGCLAAPEVLGTETELLAPRARSIHCREGLEGSRQGLEGSQ
eukprot:4770992-Alexandrium_andersonii.AAC.1